MVFCFFDPFLERESNMTHKPIKNLEKMASKDAHEWARAEMFFGEGAGVRRRHLQAEILEKMDQFPGYEALYQKHYAAQDMIKHAEKALAERKNIDRAAKAGKNLRAIKNGNINGLSTGVFIVVGGVYLAHVTGYDKVLEAEVKKGWKWAKDEIEVRKHARKIRKAKAAVYNVTNINDPQEDTK